MAVTHVWQEKDKKKKTYLKKQGIVAAASASQLQ